MNCTFSRTQDNKTIFPTHIKSFYSFLNWKSNWLCTFVMSKAAIKATSPPQPFKALYCETSCYNSFYAKHTLYAQLHTQNPPLAQRPVSHYLTSCCNHIVFIQFSCKLGMWCISYLVYSWGQLFSYTMSILNITAKHCTLCELIKWSIFFSKYSTYTFLVYNNNDNNEVVIILQSQFQKKLWHYG